MSEHDDDAGKVADTVDNLLHAMALPLPDTFHLQALREALPELDEMVSMQAASGMVHVARMTERERARREQADRDWAAGR